MLAAVSEALRQGPSDNAYLVLATLLFAVGAVGFLIRKNALVMFMCIELMLNAVNVAFVAFGQKLTDIDGQILVFFVLVVAAAEVMIGLAILVVIFRRRAEANADDLDSMSG